MCECNCSQGPHYFLPGPKGITYGLELYRGCKDCDNAPAIALYRIPNKSLGDFAPREWREPVPWVERHGTQEFAVTLVDRGLFKEAAKLDERGDLVSLATEDGDLPDDVAADVARLAWNALLEVSFKEPASSRGAGENER